MGRGAEERGLRLPRGLRLRSNGSDTRKRVPGDCGRGDGPAFSCAAGACCRSSVHEGLG